MLRTFSLILLLFLVAGTAAAQSGPKQLSAGAGVYTVRWEQDDDDTSFQGYAITATMAFGPGSAVRGDLFFTENEDSDNVKLEGWDAQFLLGSNLTRLGFKMYALGGYYTETLKLEGTTTKSTNEQDFSGMMAGLGLGYNWPSATLDFWVAWKDPGEYKDMFTDAGQPEPDITMGAGALTFGLRF